MPPAATVAQRSPSGVQPKGSEVRTVINPVSRRLRPPLAEDPHRDRHATGGRYPLRGDLAWRVRCAQCGQAENLIKQHKAQLASDRMSCHSATTNQVRLVF